MKKMISATTMIPLIQTTTMLSTNMDFFKVGGHPKILCFFFTLNILFDTKLTNSDVFQSTTKPSSAQWKVSMWQIWPAEQRATSWLSFHMLVMMFKTEVILGDYSQ